ncbi:MAG: class I SAM-dependent methyltransferase [Pseudomonadota bacterium]
MSDYPIIQWSEAGKECSARWRSESGLPPPKRVILADDKLSAKDAFRLACEGTALLWRGDFFNARQLLEAMARRADHKPLKPRKPASSANEAFHLHRRDQAQRSRILGMLLLSFESDYTLKLRRAPDVKQACEEVYGPKKTEPFVTSLRELLGLVGAHEWRKKGINITAIDGRIHPHYGIFAPVRNEYVTLVAEAPLAPSVKLAFDIGTGTGVLAAVLAHRGVSRIVATDQEPRALVCARENLTRLGFSNQVEVVKANLFPEGRAPLIVCNPPWIPVKPSSPLEFAIYDPESAMLTGFLNGLADHLTPGGEGWLILSDIAEHLGLRSREQLLAAFENANLNVIDKIDIRPHHPRTTDVNDPLHLARKAEVTSLWRLAAKQ